MTSPYDDPEFNAKRLEAAAADHMRAHEAMWGNGLPEEAEQHQREAETLRRRAAWWRLPLLERQKTAPV